MSGNRVGTPWVWNATQNPHQAGTRACRGWGYPTNFLFCTECFYQWVGLKCPTNSTENHSVWGKIRDKIKENSQKFQNFQVFNKFGFSGLPDKNTLLLQGKPELSDLFPEVYTTLGIQYYRIVLPTIFAPEARKKLYDFYRESDLPFMETCVWYCIVPLKSIWSACGASPLRFLPFLLYP